MHERFARLDRALFLEGRYVKSRASDGFDVTDPATEQRLAAIAEAAPAEIEAAVSAANAAQRDWWRATSGLERAEALHGVAARLTELRPMLAEALTREMGKPYKEAMDEVGWTASIFRYYAEIGRHDMGRVHAPSIAGQLHYTIKEPLGVAVLVMPYNFPLLLFAWQAAAALAAGNALIVKPSEVTSLTTLMAMQAFAELPAGLVQCVTGGRKTGSALVAHEKTHVVAFTGTIAAGLDIARAAAVRFKPALIETSGNDPFIVMPSAPLATAIRGAAFAAFINCGQVCTSAERFYVHDDVHDAFAEGLAREARGLRIGNGLEKVDLGPMATRAARERYEAILKRALDDGAKPLAGGGRPAGFNRGWFVEPTVLTGIAPDMAIVSEESFGPVAPIVRVRSLDEAIALSNRSRYGLGANIYTSSLEEAMRAADEIESGMVWVNAPLLDNDAAPFGGRKFSGQGRELGAEGLEQFRASKFVCINPAAVPEESSWYPYKDADAFPGVTGR